MGIRSRSYLSRRAAVGLLVVVAPFYLSACSASPSRNILGSYFPTWMICALIGLAGTAFIRTVFIRTGIDGELPAAFLVYLCVFIALTFAVWLVWLA